MSGRSEPRDAELGMLRRQVAALEARLADRASSPERSLSQQALREHEALILSISNNLPDGMIYQVVRRPDGTRQFTYVSEAVQRFYGCSAQDVKEDCTRIYGRIHEDDRERLWREEEAAAASFSTFSTEVRLRTPSGGIRWSSFSSSPRRLDDGSTCWDGIEMDITDRKRGEAARARLQERLLHAQKLESLGLLAGGVAHDFNNILLAILGNAELALLDRSDQREVLSRVEEIRKAALRAANLTRQMLAYSGKGHFDVRSLDLSRAATEMLELLGASLPKYVQLETRLAGDLPAIRADAAQIQQLAMSLVVNAGEALDSDAGGLITLETGVQTCTAQDLERSRLPEKPPPGRYVWLLVSDTGCGMSHATLEKLFDPFFTTKFTGRGLGMPAVLGIVRGHGGAIFVDSEPGKGTQVRVLFPSLEERAPLAGAPDSVAPDGAGRRGGTVLFVDDEESIRFVGLEMLRALGFEAIAAADGVEALEIYRQRGADIACIILDVSMPRMDGEQTLRELRRMGHDVPVVMSSGYATSEIEARFRGRDVAAILQKPFELNKLRDTMRALLGARTVPGDEPGLR